MGEVVAFPKRAKRKKGGNEFEVIIALSVFTYAKNIQEAASIVANELAERLEGLYVNVGHSIVAPADIPHLDA